MAGTGYKLGRSQQADPGLVQQAYQQDLMNQMQSFVPYNQAQAFPQTFAPRYATTGFDFTPTDWMRQGRGLL